jgi:enoyl-CoA hydratase
MVSSERVGSKSDVQLIQLTRPERANAIDSIAIRDLHEALDDVEAASDVKVVILTGTGDYFCAGGDLSEIEKPKNWLSEIKRLYDRIESAEYVTIAAINGAAVGGGCEMALAFDLRIMAETALIGVPEIKFGAVAFAGGTHRLVRIVGVGKAKELTLFGNLIDGTEALRIGLVNECVPAGTILDRALALADELATRPVIGVRLTKWLIETGRSVDHHSAGAIEDLVGQWIIQPTLFTESSLAAAPEDSIYRKFAAIRKANR